MCVCFVSPCCLRLVMPPPINTRHPQNQAAAATAANGWAAGAAADAVTTAEPAKQPQQLGEQSMWLAYGIGMLVLLGACATRHAPQHMRQQLPHCQANLSCSSHPPAPAHPSQALGAPRSRLTPPRWTPTCPATTRVSWAGQLCGQHYHRLEVCCRRWAREQPGFRDMLVGAGLWPQARVPGCVGHGHLSRSA